MIGHLMKQQWLLLSFFLPLLFFPLIFTEVVEIVEYEIVNIIF